MSSPRAIFEGWLEVQTKSFLNRRKWHRRYIKIWTKLKEPAEENGTVPSSETDSDGCFSALFTLDDQDSKLAQRYNLRYYCNAKYRSPSWFGEKESPAQFSYVELVTSPDVPQEKAPELVVRASREDQEQMRTLRLLSLACQEECRSVCPVSARMKQAFDREIFYATAVEAVPMELVRHVQGVTQGFRAPNQPDGSESEHPHLYGFLLDTLEQLMNCEGTMEQAAVHAKGLTGFVARVSRQLWTQNKPENKKEHEGVEGRVEALSEYQLRQLVELSVFNCHGVSIMPSLHNWVLGMPEVKQLSARIEAMQRQCGSGAELLEVMLLTIPAPWFTRLKSQQPDAYQNAHDTIGMLTPALEMVAAMPLCNTTVQKVRLWAEAILEAISLINMQLGAEQHGNGHLGGDDIPSVVLFLTCLNDMFEAELHHFVGQVILAELFCIDNYGNDARKYSLPHGGLYEDLANQYAFHADRRGIDHSHYLLWVVDTLQLISESAQEDPNPHPSPHPSPHSGAQEGQPATGEHAHPHPHPQPDTGSAGEGGCHDSGSGCAVVTVATEEVGAQELQQRMEVLAVAPQAPAPEHPEPECG